MLLLRVFLFAHFAWFWTLPSLPWLRKTLMNESIESFFDKQTEFSLIVKDGMLIETLNLNFKLKLYRLYWNTWYRTSCVLYRKCSLRQDPYATKLGNQKLADWLFHLAFQNMDIIFTEGVSAICFVTYTTAFLSYPAATDCDWHSWSCKREYGKTGSLCLSSEVVAYLERTFVLSFLCVTQFVHNKKWR